MKLLVSQAIAIALSQNGVREVNHSNTGVMVDQYLKAANEPTGEPWCASFGVWCILQACKLLGLPYPCIISGYCPDWFDWATRHGIVHTTPQAGDIGLVDESNGGKSYHHFFFVVEVGNGYIKTVEGNTNDDGSAEGDGVYIRTRALSSNYAYVRWNDLLPADASLALVLNAQPVKDANFQPVQMPVIKGVAMCPVRPWAAALGFKLGWKDENSTVVLSGHDLPGAMLLHLPPTAPGSAYLPIRDLVRDAGLQGDYVPSAQAFSVQRATSVPVH